MKVKKRLLVFVVLLMFTPSLAMISVLTQGPIGPYVKVYVDQPLGYIPGRPEGVVFSVNILIEINGIPDNSPEGIVGWGMTVCFDPDVLELGRVIGERPGYLLYDFAGGELPPYYEPLLTIIPPPPEGGCWDISEIIMPIPPGGAGESPFRPNPYLLVTLQFRSKSETAYSPIDLENVEYLTPDNTWHPVNEVIDGQYNQQIHDVAATGATFRDYTQITATYNETIEHFIYIDGTVENQGTVSETFDVSIYYKLGGQDELLTLETVTLTAGSSTVVTAALNTTDLTINLGNETHPHFIRPVGYLTIIVEASEVANEMDTSDNTFITQLLIKMPGDIDGDGCGDMFDFGYFAMAYATWFDDIPRFDQRCDFDRDGDVDMFDFGKLAMYYAKCTVYPPL